MKKEVRLYGLFELLKYIPWHEMLNKDVRYIGTDTEFSNCSIYEDNKTGEFYATNV